VSGVPKLEWNGEELKRFTERQLKKGLDLAAVTLQKIARDMAGKSNPGQVIKLKGKGKREVKAGTRIPIYIPGVGWRLSKKRRKHGGKPNRTQITVYPHSSKPGQPVKRRSGHGQKNIVWGRRGLVARVGYRTAAQYMIFHELGINYPRGGHQKRPTMVPAIMDNKRKVFDAIKRGAQSVKP
jgi:hypothetical protein